MSDSETPPSGPMHDIARRRIDVLKITVSLCLTYTLCIAFLRVWIRRNLYGVDDYAFLGATVSCFI